MSAIFLIISIASFSLGLAYLLLIRFYLQQWEKIPTWEIPTSFVAATSVSILIPARNEAGHIGHCLHHILIQTYPAHLLEILVINDHSTDKTSAQVRQMSSPLIRLIELPEGVAGKKAALTYGIGQARGELIITTDADCKVPQNWLNYLVSYYQTHSAVFITAPVNLVEENAVLERFQALDMLGTMILTGAGIQSGTIHMSNGANLAYSKAAFESVGGFTGIDHLASGDDMLLMHKMARAYPGRLAFIKQATAAVHTRAVDNWREFFQQRLRWGTKSGTYQDWRIIATLALVFFLCWGILLGPLLVFMWGAVGIIPFLVLFSFKLIADHQLLSRAAHFFQRDDLMKYFALAQLLHIAYIAIVGLAANFVKQYTWKGRQVQ